MIHKYVNNRLLPFEPQDPDERCFLHGRECYVLDYWMMEMSGTDCVAAYPFATQEELVAFCEQHHILDMLPGSQEPGTWFGYEPHRFSAEARALMERFPLSLVFPEEKCYLRPTTREGAAKLFAECVKDYTAHNTTPEREKEKSHREWLHFKHIPYHMEKLGFATANCAQFLL